MRHRSHDLHAAVEVARHPVRRAEVVLGRTVVAEHPDARVFEEPADDADHPDMLRESCDARTETADAADDQVDLHPCRRGAIERLDALGVHDRVHLGDDPPTPPRQRMRRLAIDHPQHPLPHVRRRHQQPAVLRATRIPRERVEQVADVRADRLVAGEEPDVRVDARGAGVVVARPDVHIAPDAVMLLADHERRLGVRLEAGETIDHVHAERLERARPRDVVDLVEPRLQLHQHRHLLPALRRLRERLHDRAVARGAVERHLDREHLIVARRRLDEGLHRRAERIERVVDEDLMLADHVEDRATRVAQLRRDHRDQRRVAVFRQIRRRERKQIAHVEQRPRLEDLPLREGRHLRRFARPQFVEQQLAQVHRHAGLHFDPDHLAEPTLEELLLDHREQILRLLGVRDLQVGVAREPEQIAGEHLHPREERVEPSGDQRLQRHVRVQLPRRHPARQALGDLHARESHAAGHRVAQLHREREREVADVRERVPRVDGERRQHGIHLRIEVRVDPQTLLVIELVDCDESHTNAPQQREQHLVQQLSLPSDQRAHPLVDQFELFGRRESVSRGLEHAGRELPPQASDADHVELVEIRREDREELEPLEQRRALVLRLVKHSRIELEPAELAIQERGVLRDEGVHSRLSRGTRRRSSSSSRPHRQQPGS